MGGPWTRKACLLIVGCAVAVAFAACESALAQSAAPSEVYVVSYVDIAPVIEPRMPLMEIKAAFGKATGEAMDLLRQLAASGHADPNCESIEVVQQIGSPNHFTILQKWKNAEAFEAHEAAGDMREIRNKLQPLLGSPLDERLHYRAF